MIGYVRTSSRTKEDQETSRPIQERDIRAWRRRHGHRPVRFYYDEGISGTHELADRVGLPEARAAIRRGEADGLVVRELDRLSRDLMVQEVRSLPPDRQAVRAGWACRLRLLQEPPPPVLGLPAVCAGRR